MTTTTTRDDDAQKPPRIRPQRRNANRHTQRGMGMLEGSIERDGIIGALTVAADDEVFDGSARAETLPAMGFDLTDVAQVVKAEPGRVLIIESDGSSPLVHRRVDIPSADDPKAQRLGVAANRVAQVNLDWEPGVLASVNDEAGLGALFFPDELKDLAQPSLPEPGGGGDDFDATPDEGPTRAQLGDLWVIGGVHRLLVGDCTDPANVARLMQGSKADCVFTSPPYAVGVDYGEYQDTIDNLRAMLPKLSKLWLDVVIDGGFAVVNFGDIAPARNVAGTDAPCEYPMAVEYWPIFRADDWLLWSRRVWCKPNARVNSLWCIGSNRAATDWEHLWTWRKPGKPIIERVDGEMRSALGWIDTSLMHGVDVGKEVHGAGMALGIVEWMLNIHSRPNAVVYEPFCGTGTTIIAAHRTGRRCYGCEISPKYADVILRRAEAEGLTTELVPQG